MNEPRSYKRVIIAVALLLLLAGVAAWFFRANPVERVRQLGQKLASKDLSADERKAIGKQFREEIKQLTPQQRKELRADRQKKMEDKLAALFKLPKDQQLKELDKDIDRMQNARKRWQDKQGGFGAGGPGAGPGIAGGLGGNAGGRNGQSGAAGAGGSGGAGGLQSKSPEQREAFRQTMLDNTSPQFRGQMAEYRQMLGNRMQQRGMSGSVWGR
jgi:HAMP domain-containing protein